MNDDFTPRRGIMERYRLDPERRHEAKVIEKEEQKIIAECLAKGWTQEQAETHALRCLYISGFSGPTFTD